MDKLCAHDTWLVTVLSNSRENGAEFVLKCQDVCNRLGLLIQVNGSRSPCLRNLDRFEHQVFAV